MLRDRHICPVGQMHLRGLAACRRALVWPTAEKRGEEFALRAMYRQERSLSHSSCSLESGDTLTFSQLSWSRTKTHSTHTKSTQVYCYGWAIRSNINPNVFLHLIGRFLT